MVVVVEEEVRMNWSPSLLQLGLGMKRSCRCQQEQEEGGLAGSLMTLLRAVGVMARRDCFLREEVVAGLRSCLLMVMRL